MSKLKTIREIEMERAVQPNFGKGISVASGFDLGAKAPLDSRLTVKTIDERNAHVTGNRAYEGMLVYVEADKKTYQLIDNAWQEFGFNDEKFQQNIQSVVEKNTEQDGRLDIIEGSEEVEGSIAKSLADAKAYTDSEVNKAKATVTELEKKVTANTSALGTVDSRIATAKQEAITESKEFTTSEIGKIDTAYKAADAKVLEDAKADTLEKVNAAKSELNGKIDGLTGKVTNAESEIANLKDALSNKNSNTIVVETEAEIAEANANPKVGDLAFVITSKRAYIYKGPEAVTAKNAPEGWVVFDEITNELDLVKYLKKDEAESTYRKKVDKIAEVDLATELTQKIDSKLNGNQVDSKISAAVAPISAKADANEQAIAKETADRKGEITRVEGLVTAETSARTEAIDSVKQELNGTISDVSSKADGIDTAYKAADTKLTQRIDKFVPVVSNVQPEGTETGHVWLETVTE